MEQKIEKEINYKKIQSELNNPIAVKNYRENDQKIKTIKNNGKYEVTCEKKANFYKKKISKLKLNLDTSLTLRAINSPMNYDISKNLTNLLCIQTKENIRINTGNSKKNSCSNNDSGNINFNKNNIESNIKLKKDKIVEEIVHNIISKNKENINLTLNPDKIIKKVKDLENTITSTKIIFPYLNKKLCLNKNKVKVESIKIQKTEELEQKIQIKYKKFINDAQNINKYEDNKIITKSYIDSPDVIHKNFKSTYINSTLEEKDPIINNDDKNKNFINNSNNYNLICENTLSNENNEKSRITNSILTINTSRNKNFFISDFTSNLQTEKIKNTISLNFQNDKTINTVMTNQSISPRILEKKMKIKYLNEDLNFSQRPNETISKLIRKEYIDKENNNRIPINFTDKVNTEFQNKENLYNIDYKSDLKNLKNISINGKLRNEKTKIDSNKILESKNAVEEGEKKKILTLKSDVNKSPPLQKLPLVKISGNLAKLQ